MRTECTLEQLEFQHLGKREVLGKFDGGCISSDGGALLLREVDARINLMSRLADCFIDTRYPSYVEHSVLNLVSQRVYALALGYEDLNDHDVLRADPLLATLVGHRDVLGEHRQQSSDQGCPLAGSSTLNRLELSTPEKALSSDRYKKIPVDPDALDTLLTESVR